MNKLLKYEFHKLKSQKSFRVCSFILVLLLLLSAISTKALLGNNELVADLDISVSHTLLAALTSANFSLIAGIFVVLFVCDDFEQRTIKNIFSRGYSRVSVYAAKLVACICAVTFMFIITILSSLIFGNIYGMSGSLESRVILLLLLQYLCQLGCMVFNFALSAFLRKTGSAIAATLVAPMLINMALALINSLFHIKKPQLSGYWISNFQTELENLSTGDSRLLVCAALSLIYITIFAVFGITSGKKTEF